MKPFPVLVLVCAAACGSQATPLPPDEVTLFDARALSSPGSGGTCAVGQSFGQPSGCFSCDPCGRTPPCNYLPRCGVTNPSLDKVLDVNGNLTSITCPATCPNNELCGAHVEDPFQHIKYFQPNWCIVNSCTSKSGTPQALATPGGNPTLWGVLLDCSAN